ncbi:uncharacterized protein LOC134538928 [Bacillus rossius redtenbacheri]|uniref:uncharacterized protein LOC134538928 n=1 Tax=Bacillus rossius redtenbacheri TaxID=93214 RepID=UPI002FDCD978
MAEASGDTYEESEHAETVSWAQLATNIQQRFCELFDGRPWEPVDTSPACLDNLRRNIGYALFGPPPRLPGDDGSSGYTEAQLKQVGKIHRPVVRLISGDPKAVMFLFFGVKQRGSHRTVPVFRVVAGELPDAASDSFVDHNGRVYRGWQDLARNHVFPDCLVCCPRRGLYTRTDGRVDVEFLQPAPARRVLDALNLTTALAATSVGVATLLVAVPGSVLLAATVAGVASGCYGLGQSVGHLVDRSQHGQTLGLRSSGARGDWLGVAGNTAGIALGGVDAVRSVFLQGNSGCLRLLSSLNIGCSAVKGLSVINGLADVTGKARAAGRITPLDAYQLSASVLFFGGSVISISSASSALQRLVQFDTQKVTDIIGTIEKADGVVKTFIPVTDDIPAPEEHEKKEKSRRKEARKPIPKEFVDLTADRIDSIKIINIDDHLGCDEACHETTNNLNDKQTAQGEMQSNSPLVKLINVLSSPSLKFYQIDNNNTALSAADTVNNEAITFVSFSEQSPEHSDEGKSSSAESTGNAKKGTMRGMKNVLAAIRILETPNKGKYTISGSENGTPRERKSDEVQSHNDEEKNDMSEKDVLRNLLELAKTKHTEEENAYRKGKNKALNCKPKLNKILMINRFWTRDKPDQSKHDSDHNQPLKEQNIPLDEKLQSYYFSDENTEASFVKSQTEN